MLYAIRSSGKKTERPIPCIAFVATAVALAAALGSPRSAKAEVATSENPIVIAPLTWSPTNTPVTAFKATDDLYHLQYQLLFIDVDTHPAMVAGGEVLDASTSRPTGQNLSLSDDGYDIRLKVKLFAKPGEGHAAAFVSTIPEGQAGQMFFYLTYPAIDAVPARLQHRFTAERTIDGVLNSVTAADDGVMRVSTEQPFVIAPTMRGAGWLNGNGAGPSVYDHRGILQPANGTAKPVQSFAIDWIKLDEQGRAFSGDPLKNESFFAYGQPVLSAADGLVVAANDGSRDQIPNHIVPVTKLSELYGNHVIVGIGGGKYAIYAHLKMGSVAVKAGEYVHAGDQLGELGNSGNTSAPHLHFQISDGPSVVNANALPFVINSMYYRKRIVGPIFPTVDKMTQEDFVPKFDGSGASWRKLEMPLQGDVIDFP